MPLRTLAVDGEPEPPEWRDYWRYLALKLNDDELETTAHLYERHSQLQTLTDAMMVEPASSESVLAWYYALGALNAMRGGAEILEYSANRLLTVADRERPNDYIYAASMLCEAAGLATRRERGRLCAMAYEILESTLRECTNELSLPFYLQAQMCMADLTYCQQHESHRRRQPLTPNRCMVRPYNSERQWALEVLNHCQEVEQGENYGQLFEVGFGVYIRIQAYKKGVIQRIAAARASFPREDRSIAIAGFRFKSSFDYLIRLRGGMSPLRLELKSGKWWSRPVYDPAIVKLRLPDEFLGCLVKALRQESYEEVSSMMKETLAAGIRRRQGAQVISRLIWLLK